MAATTTDFHISPEDGWVAIAVDPNTLIFRASGSTQYWLAATSGAAPAATVRGIPFNGSSQPQNNDAFYGYTGITYWVRISPVHSGEDVHIGVITD